MKELLAKHKAEVARLIFREFDEAEYMRQQEKQKEAEIAVYKEQLMRKDEQLSQKDEQLLKKDEQLLQKDELLEKYRIMLKEQGVSVPEE